MFALALTASCLAVSCLSAPAFGAEKQSRWFAGGSIAYRSTMDEIRSNAQIAIGPLGADGIPWTFDVGETESCLDPNVFCDLRPDYMLNSPAVIQDSYQLDLHGGYLISGWLSVQLDASYFKAGAGPIDGYLTEHYPFTSIPDDPLSFFYFRDHQEKFPIRAGTIAETPVFLTTVVHFKTKGWLKPYLGAGYGRIFTALDPDSDIAALNERLSSLRIRAITDAFGRNIAPKDYNDPFNDAHIPLGSGVRVELADVNAWQITGGAEWMVTRRVGVLFDARYQFVPGGLTAKVSGHDQVDLVIWSEKMFRPDGTVRIFNQHDKAPNPLCLDNDFRGVGCPQNFIPPDARVDPGAIRPFSNPPTPYYTCPALGDFDRNGSLDVCYGDNINPSVQGWTEPRGDMIIQGGQLSLTAFTVSVGVRVHF